MHNAKPLKGIITVYKPSGPTSHDIINQLRRLTGERRIGHAGTLDPLASGVLVVGIGRAATKQLSTVVAKEKEYEAVIRLGAISTTDDAEGDITEQAANPPTLKLVQDTLQQYIGIIEQVPPVYSAVKIKGQPAHRRARKGQQIQLKPRRVDIKSIALIQYQWPALTIRVVCGPGVYIRSLARDIGQACGTGGYVTALKRTRVGSYTLDEAIKLNTKHELP